MSTTARRRYRYRSRADAEDRVAEVERSQTVLLRALNEVLAGRVHWLERLPYRFGIVCPESPTGGIVIVEYHSGGTVKQWATAYYLDDWCHEQKQEYEQDPGRFPDTARRYHFAQEVRAERDRLAGN
jgi:hypothetical protein